MFKIISKKALTPNIYKMDIEAHLIARAAHPGQFIMLRLDEQGERIPLTICDYNQDQGTVTIVFQTVGYTTYKNG